MTLGRKFNVSPQDLWEANHFDSKPTVYSNTTFLVPLRGKPKLINITDSPPPASGFLPTVTIEKTGDTKLRKLFIAGWVVGFFLVVVLVALPVCGLYLKALRKWKREKLLSFNCRSSPFSRSTPRSSLRLGQTGSSSATLCLSPDLLARIKFSLINYSIEDVRRATKDFSEDTKIGKQVYKGLVGNVELMIRQLKFDDMRRVIDVQSKINHKNTVNLHGVCYGENDFSWSYLLFESPSNGCLRECLSNPSNPLPWQRRTQITFDIATALHHLHYCIFPSISHVNIDSRNIYLIAEWRAKLANIGSNPGGSSSKGNDNIVTADRWVAPAYLVHRSASEKVDIFAFGDVLLGLILGREDMEGRQFRDSIGFLGGGASVGGCFEQLRIIMDPSLAQALCLAVLAKACVEDDPLLSPSIDDILKVLGRMI